MMQIQVRLAEPFWRAVGQRHLTLTLPPGDCVGDLLDELCAAYPKLTQELVEAPPHIFIGDDEASTDTLLTDADQVHLVWAVAGG